MSFPGEKEEMIVHQLECQTTRKSKNEKKKTEQ